MVWAFNGAKAQATTAEFAKKLIGKSELVFALIDGYFALRGLVSFATVAPSLLKTSAGEAFFWSGRTAEFGGAERALQIAKSQGGTTLEGLIESKGIKMPAWDPNNPVSIKAWEDISAEYASHVSGKVRAVVGENLRPGNIWENVELPKLKANKNVTEIITIDQKLL